MLDFEWDEEKARSNLRKHGVSFDDAVLAFDDDSLLEVGHEVASDGEVRRLALASFRLRIYFLVFVERGNVLRIISARKANRRERQIYSENRY
jgi:uncharacterized DUF497 family protein